MLVEGVQYVAAEKGVRFAFSLMTLAMLAAGVVRVLNPLFVRDVLHLDIRLVGGLSTSMSAGMLLGSVLTGLLARRLQPPTIALIGMGGAGLSFLVFALGVPWELGLVSYFCFGCFNPPIFISISAHLQRVVHADRLGRVFGMLGAMNQSASLAGMACAGPLSAGVGVQPTLIGAALAFCSLGLMGRFLPGYIAMRAADAAVATAAETE
jgi:MFS family permease